MSHALLRERNGPSQVAAQQQNIDKTFTIVSGQLFKFHEMIMESQGASRIEITPAHKIKLYNDFYKVANTHPSVAQAFVDKLKNWSAEKLVPEYRKSLDEALATGDDDTIFQAISRNFVCFSLVAKVTATIFHNVNNQLAEAPTGPKIDAPKQVLFNAYREQFYERIRAKIQSIFFRRVSEVRSEDDATKVAELRPIADIFAYVARTAPAPAAGSRDKTDAYQRDYVDKYVERMVIDNKNAVKSQMAQGVPANVIAEWINRRADFEQSLLNSLVAPDGNLHAAIMRQYDDQVVASCTKDLINDEKHGFAACFRNGDKTIESFNAAIELFHISARIEKNHKDCVEECVREFRKAVTDRLKRLISETKAPIYDNPNEHAKAFIKAFLDELHILDQTIVKMKKHTDLQRANVDCFKNVLNSSDDACVIWRKCKRGASNDEKKVPFPEVLATFVDLFLKSDEGSSANVDAATETVSDVGALFHFVQDKDIFGEHYKLRLSKRLLTTKYNEDLELQILEKMQKQSGKHFIHKFEGMINDLRVANTIQQTFEDANVAMPCSFGIKVLTFAYWPQIKPDDTFVFPESLKICQETFTRHYRVKNPTRLLKWQAERGSAVVDVAFPKGTKEVAMTIHQAAVMIAIDAESSREGGARPLTAISSETGIEVAELKPLVASMMLAKGLQLVRVKGSGMNPKFTETDTVEMNPDYSTKMRKLKIPTATTARTAASETVKDETIDASRGQMLDAAIVRIMKSRKEMRQQDLVENTIQAVLRFFHPQPRHIKLRIEQLMAKEFLERDENESDLYRYLA